MNRKRFALVAVAVLTQLWLGRCLMYSRWAMERHWCEFFSGRFDPGRSVIQFVTASSELPSLSFATIAALRFGMLIPIVGLVATLVVAVKCRRDSDDSRLLLRLFVVTVVSLLLTAYYAFGIAAPPLSTTYRM